MIININGAKCIGIEAVPVTVEVDISTGIGIHLVGLADAAVKESLLRTVSALNAIGYRVPGRKIVINLAPADMQKKGSGYDLPIALGIIAASGQCDMPDLGKYIIMGELGLDAGIRKIHGALPIAELAQCKGFAGCILPAQSAAEAAEYEGAHVFGVENLADVLEIVGGKEGAERFSVRKYTAGASRKRGDKDYMDFSEIIGQEAAKRGLEIAAAGGHNAILIGAPGCGKSSLAKAMKGILPPMSMEESMITSKIYSVAGCGPEGGGLIRERPFRSPHYSASLPAIIGGGNGENIVPGEISLAENGILFLDEFAQMPKSVMEALRGPLEDRKVVISRLRSKVEFPASFMLVAAANPCPCGYYGEGDRCMCTAGQRMSYMERLSGPVMDRIDVQLWLQSLPAGKLVRKEECESSAEVAARVMRAREIQKLRFRDEGIFTNAEMSVRQTGRFCRLSEQCKDLLEKVISQMGLSARAVSRIIRLARTVADLGEQEDISPANIAEAAGLRFLDRINNYRHE